MTNPRDMKTALLAVVAAAAFIAAAFVSVAPATAPNPMPSVAVNER